MLYEHVLATNQDRTEEADPQLVPRIPTANCVNQKRDLVHVG